jgi:hypothetical protein
VRLDLSAPLPIVPPPEEDELISSWLYRVARFYGTPTWELFGLIRGKTTVSLYAVDLGTSEPALNLIAKRLGITNMQLFIHTISGVYPWAVDLVARDPYKSTRRYPQRLWYAACPICLEHQKVSRGFSWLWREWVLAARTICQIHNEVLLEGDVGSIVHPAWSDFLRLHRNVRRPGCNRLRPVQRAGRGEDQQAEGGQRPDVWPRKPRPAPGTRYCSRPVTVIETASEPPLRAV